MLSLKFLAARILRYTRQITEVLGKYHPASSQIEALSIPENLVVTSSNSGAPGSSGFWKWSVKAKDVVVENILRKVSNPLASELKQKVSQRLLYGDARPFLALVGITLASNSGIITKEDELEALCWHIRDTVNKLDVSDEDGWEDFTQGYGISLTDLHFVEPIAKGCNAVVYSAILTKGDKEKPVAVKMLFNYDTESYADSIFRAMQKELLPVRYPSDEVAPKGSFVFLPPHPNIVNIGFSFADRIPELPHGAELYPNALPSRIHPEGCGRNMSLFLIMERYECTLDEYLSSHNPPMKVRVKMFVQLLEGVYHLVRHHVAHRDLKLDNILVCLRHGESHPHLVITDFGCCLANMKTGLSVPYPCGEIDKGGNIALMAPEIISASPGTFTRLFFDKSDLWALGTLAYEIFGCPNPFYKGHGDSPQLTSRSYVEEDLPDLPTEVPTLIRGLVRLLLKRNPSERPSAEIAATIGQLSLWAPSSWFSFDLCVSNNEIMEWLLSLTSKCFFDSTLKEDKEIFTHYLLIYLFLSRFKLHTIKSSLGVIRKYVI